MGDCLSGPAVAGGAAGLTSTNTRDALAASGAARLLPGQSRRVGLGRGDASYVQAQSSPDQPGNGCWLWLHRVYLNLAGFVLQPPDHLLPKDEGGTSLAFKACG